MPRLLLATLLLLGSIATAPAALPVAVDGKPLPSLAPMLDRVTAAVVNIATSNQRKLRRRPLLDDPFFHWFFEGIPQERQRQAQSLGSGIIVDARKGLILTNHHVIEEADEIRVTLKDGRSFRARLLGKDPEMDIAVLQIPAEDLTAIPWGNSDELRVGDFVVAIGSPFGLSQTVTSGIVSALGRSGLGIEGYENFIQTDASINPGNSGGPLVNLRGELVGINTAILAPGGGNVGIGFAIPGNLTREVLRQIVEYGGLKRGVFGVSIQNLSGNLAHALGLERPRGALIAEVRPRSPAEQAGLQVGDVVTHIDNHDIANASDFHARLGLARIGQNIRLRVLRGGKTLSLDATIAGPYAGFVPGERLAPMFAGALLGEVVDESRFGRNPAVVVGTVTTDSAAWHEGLREGDVIYEINGHRGTSIQQLTRLLRGTPHIWQIRLRRGEHLLTLIFR